MKRLEERAIAFGSTVEEMLARDRAAVHVLGVDDDEILAIAARVVGERGKDPEDIVVDYPLWLLLAFAISGVLGIGGMAGALVAAWAGNREMMVVVLGISAVGWAGVAATLIYGEDVIQKAKKQLSLGEQRPVRVVDKGEAAHPRPPQGGAAGAPRAGAPVISPPPASAPDRR